MPISFLLHVDCWSHIDGALQDSNRIGNKKQDVRSIQFMFYCLNSGVVSLLSMERQIKHFMTIKIVFFSYICNIM